MDTLFSRHSLHNLELAHSELEREIGTAYAVAEILLVKKDSGDAECLDWINRSRIMKLSRLIISLHLLLTLCFSGVLAGSGRGTAAA